MASVTTNANQVSKRYAERAANLTAAAERGTKRVLLAIERKATDNLSGSGGPGSYPIPVRSRREWVVGKGAVSSPGGNLRRSMGVRQLSAASGLVFNRARYARAVHTTGFHAYGNPAAPFYKPRPFLSDAVDQVDTMAIFQREMREAVFS